MMTRRMRRRGGEEDCQLSLAASPPPPPAAAGTATWLVSIGSSTVGGGEEWGCQLSFVPAASAAHA